MNLWGDIDYIDWEQKGRWDSEFEQHRKHLEEVNSMVDIDYNAMSDFEINLAVMRIAKGWKGSRISNDETSASGYTEPLVIQGSHVGCTTFWFDPCNDPTDAWPIIIETGITFLIIDCRKKPYHWAASTHNRNFSGRVYHANENPLRAAMIVYLMINAHKG